MKKQTKFKVGDKVEVEPRYPAAIGKGTGTVVRVGATGYLLQVKFNYCKYPLACFAEDCKAVR